jgi:hypothetical protein
MRTRFFSVIVMIAAFSTCLGCSNGNISIREESLLDRNWGRSFESAKYNQILDPDAGKKEEPVKELDGRAAQRTTDQYLKSFGGESGGSSTGGGTSNVNMGAMTPGITPGKQAQ